MIKARKTDREVADIRLLLQGGKAGILASPLPSQSKNMKKEVSVFDVLIYLSYSVILGSLWRWGYEPLVVGVFAFLALITTARVKNIINKDEKEGS